MRWLATLATFGIAMGAAVADPRPAGKPAGKAEVTEKAGCKRRVVGRGLDRKVVCELAPVIVKSDAPKPNVVIVPHDGKNVTGRPRSTDPFVGLDRRLR